MKKRRMLIIIAVAMIVILCVPIGLLAYVTGMFDFIPTPTYRVPMGTPIYSTSNPATTEMMVIPFSTLVVPANGWRFLRCNPLNFDAYTITVCHVEDMSGGQGWINKFSLEAVPAP
jgi:hypothetical protein